MYTGKYIKQTYSIPSIVIIGESRERIYDAIAGFTVYPYRMVLITTSNGRVNKINNIPFTLGGDIVEEIFSKCILKNEKPSSLLEEAIYHMLFTGGFLISIYHKNLAYSKPLSLFLPSKNLAYYLIIDEKHDNDLPTYRLEDMILLGYLLQEGRIDPLIDFCRQTKICNVQDKEVFINVWRRSILGVCSKESHSIEEKYRAIRIYPDNNPLRHIIVYKNP
ncbi:hypothetical protein J4526_09590 [Desulfurococcaceae archaeon MEX13E-LK6-19]|nr:hypothetical protein J4526_09590 [Desulfurococcaceae archaeon MEX13E-LK6-19]